MFDPIVAFFQRVFTAIGRGIGLAVAWLLWPFIAVGNWYRQRSWIIKGPIGIILLGLNVDFDRYYLPLVLTFAIGLGVGVGEVTGWLLRVRARSPREARVPQPVEVGRIHAG